MTPEGRIIVAYDGMSTPEAAALAKRLNGRAARIKLGKEFFTACGPQGARAVAESGLDLFLDLKFHDIPNTVAGAVRAAAPLRAKLLTVHAAGGPAMIRAAADAAAEAGATRPALLAVTMLTSLDDADAKAIGFAASTADMVVRLAKLAIDAGADGLVCSPREVARLRVELGETALLVCPGVRPAWAAKGDQKRVMTPGDAIRAGANYLVIGRPITQAAEPADAAQRIAEEIAAAT